MSHLHEADVYDNETLSRRSTHLFDEADEVRAVLPSNERLPLTLDARTAVIVVYLTAAKRSAPWVQLVGVQLGSEALQQHVYSVYDQRRLQLSISTLTTLSKVRRKCDLLPSGKVDWFMSSALTKLVEGLCSASSAKYPWTSDICRCWPDCLELFARGHAGSRGF